MFPADLERNAYRANNGEFGWTYEQVPRVIEILRANAMGILGGELWWVRSENEGWTSPIPQAHGEPAVYCWATDRGKGEPWAEFVERSAAEALDATKKWPERMDTPADLPGRVLCNLTWVSEAEF
jgi:hypothetical protein